MKKDTLKKILATSTMGLMAFAMPFVFTGCQKDADINVRIDGEYVQWQMQGDNSWKNLLTIDEILDAIGEDIKGETGSQGEQGVQGEAGQKGDKGDQGDPGQKGDKGDQGNPGINGKEVEFRVEDGYIQWRYVNLTQGENDNWINLIELEDLKGDKGDSGQDLVTEKCVVTYNLNLSEFCVKKQFIEEIQNGLFEKDDFTLSFEECNFDLSNPIIKYSQIYNKGDYFQLFNHFDEYGIGEYFEGWYYGDLKVDNLRIVAGNLELTAKWNKNISDMVSTVYPADSILENTIEYIYDDNNLTARAKPNEYSSSSVIIRDYVFARGKFYKVTSFSPYYNGELVWKSEIALPSSLDQSCLIWLFEYPLSDYRNILYIPSNYNFTTKSGYVGDYAIIDFGSRSTGVYRLDWEKREASLIYIGTA